MKPLARLKTGRFGRDTVSDMLFKVIIVFLGLIVLVALIGRVLFPSALPRAMRKRSGPLRCGKCGRYLIGQKTCDCGARAK